MCRLDSHIHTCMFYLVIVQDVSNVLGLTFLGRVPCLRLCWHNTFVCTRTTWTPEPETLFDCELPVKQACIPRPPNCFISSLVGNQTDLLVCTEVFGTGREGVQV